MKVPFLDLTAQHARIRPELDAALDGVIRNSAFVGGAHVQALEHDLAQRLGLGFGVGTSCCTAALAAIVRGLGLGAGDEVIVPALTAMPTSEAPVLAGARTVFADVLPDTLQIDPADVARKVTDRTRAVIAVHLYGLAAPLEPLLALCRERGLVLIEDLAQALGARWQDRPLGSFGRAAAISFFPSKPLGGFGDGGMVVTSDAEIARSARMYGNHGRLEKFTHETLGANERLDALQAAVLRVKLRHLDEWNARRRQVAGWYAEELAGIDEVRPVAVVEGTEPVWHVYVVRAAQRDELRRHLSEHGIGTGLHYPSALNVQPAWAHAGQGAGSMPVAEAATAEIVSLPMDPFLTREQVACVASGLKSFYAARPAPASA